MKNVLTLDCTLRDGGRIINCSFPDSDINGIVSCLFEANIDIIEIGFIRDERIISYNGNSTFFTDTNQISRFLIKNDKTIYTAFIDFGMCNINSLKPYDGTSIDGVRLGFTKKDYLNSYHELVRWAKLIKEKGYKLFLQGVNSLNYSDDEILKLLNMANEIKPFSFAIVDTYGAMYMDDVDRLFNLIDENMDKSICINFHSHNNYQLSFAFAQEIIKLSNKTSRKVIIDGTLYGMGKVAGNLNLELLVEYLVRKHNYNYNLDVLLDCIDDYIYKYRLNNEWGYSIPGLMAGIYKSHPNNVIFLTEKYRLQSKDIGRILSMIEPLSRQRYDYNNIQKLYIDFNHTKVNDRFAILKIKQMLEKRNVLVLMPGYSLSSHKMIISDFISRHNPFVISINFDSKDVGFKNDMMFFGSQKRFSKLVVSKIKDEVIVAVSNIALNKKIINTFKILIVDYESLINRNYEEFDNTTIMLFNLFKRIGLSNFYVAGFDGFDCNSTNYYDDSLFNGSRFERNFSTITDNMIKMLKDYSLSLEGKGNVHFLTPSIYEDIFKEGLK